MSAMSVKSMLDPDETYSENDEDDEVGEDYEDAEPRLAPAQDDEHLVQEGEEAPSNTNNAEEDGHINAVGIDYRQPRVPFVGTTWKGAKNALIRTDEFNTSRPSGSRPQGYIWVVSTNGHCRTLTQTLADEVRLVAHFAQRQRLQGTSTETLFRPNVPNNSLLEMTWYIGALCHDAPYVWSDRTSTAFCMAVGMCGANSGAQVMMSYERGERKELGHLPRASRGCLRTKASRSASGAGCVWLCCSRLVCTARKSALFFFTGQTWEFMGGCVQKNMGKPHYRFFACPPIDDGERTICGFSYATITFIDKND